MRTPYQIISTYSYEGGYGIDQIENMMKEYAHELLKIVEVAIKDDKLQILTTNGERKFISGWKGKSVLEDELIKTLKQQITNEQV